MRSIVMIVALSVSLWPLSIEKAIERTLQASPVLKKAKSDIRTSRFEERELASTFYPTVSSGFEWSRTDKITAFGYTPAYNYNLSAKYNIFNGMSDYHTLKAQRFQSKAKELMYQAKASDVRLGVIAAYSNCLKAQKAVITRQQALTSLERAYRDIKIRYEQGVSAKNDLLLLDVDRLSAKQAVVAAKSALKRARSNLNRVMGGALRDGDKIEEFSKKLSSPAPFERLLRETYAKRSEMKALEMVRIALSENYRATYGSYLPRVDVGASYMANDREVRVDNIGVTQLKDTTRVTVSASWDLYQGGASEARRLKVLEEVNKQVCDVESLKLDLEYQLTDAMEAYNTAKSALILAKKSKESAQENYRITRERHNLGDVDTLVLLTAQANLTSARNQYHNAYYDLYTAVATIQRVSGE